MKTRRPLNVVLRYKTTMNGHNRSLSSCKSVPAGCREHSSIMTRSVVVRPSQSKSCRTTWEDLRATWDLQIRDARHCLQNAKALHSSRLRQALLHLCSLRLPESHSNQGKTHKTTSASLSSPKSLSALVAMSVLSWPYQAVYATR